LDFSPVFWGPTLKKNDSKRFKSGNLVLSEGMYRRKKKCPSQGEFLKRTPKIEENLTQSFTGYQKITLI